MALIVFLIMFILYKYKNANNLDKINVIEYSNVDENNTKTINTKENNSSYN